MRLSAATLDRLGPRSCFAAAVYEQDWAGIVTAPGEVTMPFTFDGDGVR